VTSVFRILVSVSPFGESQKAIDSIWVLAATLLALWKRLTGERLCKLRLFLV